MTRFGRLTGSARALPVSVRTIVELAAAAVLVGMLGIRSCQLDRARVQLGKTALEADTLRASLDTTHVVNVGLADSLRTVQRQVVQVRADKDDLDRTLGLERIAKAQLTAQVERLETIANSSAPVTETPEGVRTAEFVVDSTPFHVNATVSLPRPPGLGRISLGVAVDDIPLEARHGCSPPNDAGIRSAYLTVTGPEWARVRVDRVEQDPGLCRSPVLEPPKGDGRAWWRKLVDRAGVSTGFGAAAGLDVTGKPNAVVGATVTVGVKIWP